WGYISGNTIDKNDPVWKGLDKILFSPIKHESGAQLVVRAVSIDSSDGTTSDAVYHYVRTRQRRGVMAVKGSSNDYGNREIFSKPKATDTRGRHNTKADKHGLQVYIVGTHKAKDLIASRMKLPGTGPGRMHWYQNIRADYYDQMTGEVKAPHRSMRGKRVWQKKAGAAVEALDCEVYALHASRAIRVHLMGQRQWDELEQTLLQPGLFGSSEMITEEPSLSFRKRGVRSKGV
ncbi:MAG: terminase gpA endonuclease subunit, partial [Candidatus Hermodarchaeota archaeon]